MYVQLQGSVEGNEHCSRHYSSPHFLPVISVLINSCAEILRTCSYLKTVITKYIVLLAELLQKREVLEYLGFLSFIRSRNFHASTSILRKASLMLGKDIAMTITSCVSISAICSENFSSLIYFDKIVYSMKSNV